MFLDVYSSDSIRKYINFYDIIKKEQNNHLQFSTLTEKIKQERISEAFLIFIEKTIYFYLRALVLLALSNLLLIMTVQLKCYLIWKINRNNHINLVSLTFSIEAYKKIKGKNSLENLTDTVKHFFHMIFQFAKLKGQIKK